MMEERLSESWAKADWTGIVEDHHPRVELSACPHCYAVPGQMHTPMCMELFVLPGGREAEKKRNEAERRRTAIVEAAVHYVRCQDVQHADCKSEGNCHPAGECKRLWELGRVTGAYLEAEMLR